MNKSAQRPSESWEQAQVVNQLRAGGYLLASIPNDAKRTTLGHVQAARRGMTTGASDLLVFTPPPAKPWARGVVMEFKRRLEGDWLPGSNWDEATPEQCKFLRDMLAIGWEGGVFHGASEALTYLRGLGYSVATLGPPVDSAT